MIKALLWNHKEFKEVSLDPNSKIPVYQQVNELIGARTMTAIQFNMDLEAYVDDEGLLIENPTYGALWVDEITGKVHQPIGGKVLFVNHNDQGETVDLTYEQLKMIKHLQKHKMPEGYETLVIPFYREAR